MSPTRLSLAVALAWTLACAAGPTLELPTDDDAPADDEPDDEAPRKERGGGDRGGKAPADGLGPNAKAGCRAMATALERGFSGKPQFSRGEGGLCTVDSRGDAKAPDAAKLMTHLGKALSGWTDERRLEDGGEDFARIGKRKGSDLCAVTLTWTVDPSSRAQSGHAASASCGPESNWP